MIELGYFGGVIVLKWVNSKKIDKKVQSSAYTKGRTSLKLIHLQ